MLVLLAVASVKVRGVFVAFTVGTVDTVAAVSTVVTLFTAETIDAKRTPETVPASLVSLVAFFPCGMVLSKSRAYSVDGLVLTLQKVALCCKDLGLVHAGSPTGQTLSVCLK
jgi:hypothetical protein